MLEQRDKMKSTQPVEPSVRTRRTQMTQKQVLLEELNGNARMKEMELKRREDELRKQEALLEKKLNNVEASRREWIKLKQDLEEAIIEAKKQGEKYINDNVDGLTRNNIFNREWHKQNPNAASHLFGFSSWKETIMMTHALFKLLPPLKGKVLLHSDPITKFEWCLLAKMRMHVKLSNRLLSILIGRSESWCTRNITLFAMDWGEAGLDFSILDIDKDFLVRTCPQSYKDEGLEKICAIPDRKDFMIHTTRQNTLFTRASYSDKVHHSAVRCISWSMPNGLSFEHTDLFLA